MKLDPKLIKAIQKVERISQMQFNAYGYLDYGHSVWPSLHWEEEEELSDLVFGWDISMPDYIAELNGNPLSDLVQTLYDFCHISWTEKELIMVEWYGRAPFDANTGG